MTRALRESFVFASIERGINGALLGGDGAVELVKRLTGYTKATGDLFAVIAPLGLALGRVGCLASGCCLGRPMDAAWYTIADRAGIYRWPAVPLEFAFNVLMAAVALLCWQRGRLPGQLFHIYLMSYGLFRLAHEFFRDTPRLVDGVTGYQVLAVGIFLLGFMRYLQRRRETPGFALR